MNAGWDDAMLASELKALAVEDFDLGMLGFDEAEIEKLIPRDVVEDDPGPLIDRAAELQEKWGTERGQVWEIGKHRLMCGDCTSRQDVKTLTDGGVDLLLTDPPYCSGGFQEAGKHSGSIGTRGDERIANDTLSTRGYMAMMKAAIELTNAGVCYIFTDWRMWITLFDVAESSGFGVRNMIVWDKGTPGMGRGWRSQHELILCGMRVTQPFDPTKAQGNVIQDKRTGNVNHPTEKPVELIAKLMDVTDMCKKVYDPFAGSGTTLVAAEQMNRACYAMDLAPPYVAVCLERMAALGLEPRLAK